jgi:hypothetical protein
MGSIIALVLIAGVLVPIVCLLGFAGCTYTPPVPGISAPTDLTLVDVGATTVTLSWINPGELSLAFEIERLQEGATSPERIAVSAFATAMVQVVDPGVAPATSYFYQVRAVRLSDDVTSGLSNSVFATTLS